MSGFSITVEDRAVASALDAIRAHLADMRPAFEKIGQALVTAKDLGFRGQRDPWGTAWHPLAASTIAGRRKRGVGSKILRDTGILQDSISYQPPTPTSVIVGTIVEYASVHQFGKDIRHAARSGTVNFKRGRDGSVGNRFVKASKADFAQSYSAGPYTQRIPARPFLPISPAGAADLPQDQLQTIIDALRTHLFRSTA